MKRLAAVVLALVLGCASMALVAGCGSSSGGSSSYAGTWVPTSVTTDEGQTSLESLEALGYTADQIMTLVLNEDGSADITLFGTSMSSTGVSMTWEATDNGVSVASSDSSSASYELAYDSSAQTLTMEYSGYSMTLSKQ